MLALLRAALVSTLALMVLTGLVYPYALTGLCQLLMSSQANGSLVHGFDGKVVGSELIGQGFSDPGHFWPRPSSAGNNGYDPQASGPSNLGPTSQKLVDQLRAEAQKARAEGVTGPIAADELTGSGSGLDPDISVENALQQVPRIAKARGVGEDQLRKLVNEHVQERALGLFGEPRVNVLELNLGLGAGR